MALRSASTTTPNRPAPATASNQVCLYQGSAAGAGNGCTLAGTAGFAAVAVLLGFGAVAAEGGGVCGAAGAVSVPDGVAVAAALPAGVAVAAAAGGSAEAAAPLPVEVGVVVVVGAAAVPELDAALPGAAAVVVVAEGLEAGVPGLVAVPVAAALPQMSSLVRPPASPGLGVVAGVTVAEAVVAAGALTAGTEAAVEGADVVVPAGAGLPALSCSSLSFFCSSASSESLRLSRRSFLVLSSSSSLTRDFSSPASCSRLARASFVRASSVFRVASPLPPPVADLSPTAWLPEPALGGTRASLSPGLPAAGSPVAGLVPAAGAAVATTVGLAAALPLRQASFCALTSAAAAAAEAAALISSLLGTRRIAPRFSELMLSW